MITNAETRIYTLYNKNVEQPSYVYFSSHGHTPVKLLIHNMESYSSNQL